MFGRDETGTISTRCAPVAPVVVDGKDMEASMAAVEEVEGAEVT